MKETLAQKLIRMLGVRMKDETIHLDANGACVLLFDGKLRVQLQEDRGGEALLWIAELGPVPEFPEHRLALYEDLLRANFIFQGTLGATLSVHPSSDCVVLCREIELREIHGVDMLEASLGQFVELAERWRHRIEQKQWQNPRDHSLKSAPVLSEFERRLAL